MGLLSLRASSPRPSRSWASINLSRGHFSFSQSLPGDLATDLVQCDPTAVATVGSPSAACCRWDPCLLRREHIRQGCMSYWACHPFADHLGAVVFVLRGRLSCALCLSVCLSVCFFSRSLSLSLSLGVCLCWLVSPWSFFLLVFSRGVRTVVLPHMYLQAQNKPSAIRLP